MIYSKRRKNLGGGHTKRSNRKSYGLKRYSKNIANISGYRQKGGTGVVNWVKQKLGELDKDTIIRKINKYNEVIQNNESDETIKNKYKAKLEDLKKNGNYIEAIEQIEAEKVAQAARAWRARRKQEEQQEEQQKATRCETISKDIGTLDDYNRMLEEAKDKDNGNLDNLDCLYEMKKWTEFKAQTEAQTDLDEFLKKNEGKTYMEMIEILQKSERQSDVKLFKLFKLFEEKYKDNYLKELTAWMISNDYYGLSVKDVEYKIERFKYRLPYRAKMSTYEDDDDESIREKYSISIREKYSIVDAINDFKDKMEIDALSQILKYIKDVKSKQKEEKAKREAKDNAKAMAKLARKRETEIFKDKSTQG